MNRTDNTDVERRSREALEIELMNELGLDVEGFKSLKKRIGNLSRGSRRGVETLFRLASRNQYTLTTMVDRKSNILISINAILLSIILGTTIGQIEEYPHLLIPVLLILTTNLLSIVYAVVATRPAKRHEDPEAASEQQYHNNLLFYGDYTRISESEYIKGMRYLTHQGEELYDAISRDVYYTGKILQKKFGYLRISFNIFMFGLIISVIAFVASNLFVSG
jgi:hypothetical protein